MNNFEPAGNAARAGCYPIRKSFGSQAIDGEVIHACHADHTDTESCVVVLLRDGWDRIYKFEAPRWWADWQTGAALTDELVGLRLSIYGEVTADVDSLDAELPSAGTLYIGQLKDVSFVRSRPASFGGWSTEISPFKSRRRRDP